MHWPGIEPGLPAWQARILPLNWHQWPIKNWLVALYEALWSNFCGENRKGKGKQNKTKTHKNKQTNIKGEVEKGIQIIQEKER